MSRDFECPWCGALCREGMELFRHLDENACNVTELKEAIQRLWDDVENLKMAAAGGEDVD